jgi:hypothetical protein
MEEQKKRPQNPIPSPPKKNKQTKKTLPQRPPWKRKIDQRTTN